MTNTHRDRHEFEKPLFAIGQPVAVGLIQNLAGVWTLLAGFGIASVERIAVGTFRITLAENFLYDTIIVECHAQYNAAAYFVGGAHTGPGATGGPEVEVYTRLATGALTDDVAIWSIVVRRVDDLPWWG